MKSVLRTALILFLICTIAYSQTDEDKLTIVGDLLEGGTRNGEKIQSWIGNVVMTQNDIRVTCENAIRFLNSNEVELIGNVVAVQDTITIYTEHVYYYGDTEYAVSDSAITLNDGRITLSADRGNYSFDTKKSEFFGNVVLFDRESKLNSNELYYFNEIDKVIASGNARLADSVNYIYADSLVSFRNEEESFAFKKVMIRNFENNTTITGAYLEDKKKENYSKIEGNAFLTQIDTSESGVIDTLYLRAKKLEALKDSVNSFIATDSVRIVRGDFASRNDKSYYYQNADRIVTSKLDPNAAQPVLWFENSQLLGDSINIKLSESSLKYIEMFNNSFILSKNKAFEFRFDQIMGDSIKISFENSDISKTKVNGNVLSIYYNYEDSEPNGLIKSSSGKSVISFDDNEVSDVRLYEEPVSEFHPENVIKGKEKDFTLPVFRLIKGRPTKRSILFSN